MNKGDPSDLSSRMLKLRTAADIDRASIVRWLRAAAKPPRS